MAGRPAVRKAVAITKCDRLVNHKPVTSIRVGMRDRRPDENNATDNSLANWADDGKEHKVVDRLKCNDKKHPELGTPAVVHSTAVGQLSSFDSPEGTGDYGTKSEFAPGAITGARCSYTITFDPDLPESAVGAAVAGDVYAQFINFLKRHPEDFPSASAESIVEQYKGGLAEGEELTPEMEERMVQAFLNRKKEQSVAFKSVGGETTLFFRAMRLVKQAGKGISDDEAKKFNWPVITKEWLAANPGIGQSAADELAKLAEMGGEKWYYCAPRITTVGGEPLTLAEFHQNVRPGAYVFVFYKIDADYRKAKDGEERIDFRAIPYAGHPVDIIVLMNGPDRTSMSALYDAEEDPDMQEYRRLLLAEGCEAASGAAASAAVIGPPSTEPTGADLDKAAMDKLEEMGVYASCASMFDEVDVEDEETEVEGSGEQEASAAGMCTSGNGHPGGVAGTKGNDGEAEGECSEAEEVDEEVGEEEVEEEIAVEETESAGEKRGGRGRPPSSKRRR